METNKLEIKKVKSTNGGYLHKILKLYPEHQTTEHITYYSHPKMIVGVHIKIGDEEGKYWNGTKEVLLDAIYNGYCYRCGLNKYKSERSLCLRINKFVNYILNDK